MHTLFLLAAISVALGGSCFWGSVRFAGSRTKLAGVLLLLLASLLVLAGAMIGAGIQLAAQPAWVTIDMMTIVLVVSVGFRLRDRLKSDRVFGLALLAAGYTAHSPLLAATRDAQSRVRGVGLSLLRCVGHKFSEQALYKHQELARHGKSSTDVLHATWVQRVSLTFWKEEDGALIRRQSAATWIAASAEVCPVVLTA